MKIQVYAMKTKTVTDGDNRTTQASVPDLSKPLFTAEVEIPSDLTVFFETCVDWVALTAAGETGTFGLRLGMKGGIFFEMGTSRVRDGVRHTESAWNAMTQWDNVKREFVIMRQYGVGQTQETPNAERTGAQNQKGAFNAVNGKHKRLACDISDVAREIADQFLATLAEKKPVKKTKAVEKTDDTDPLTQ